MKWNLIYFEDRPDTIKCYQDLLQEKFNVVGHSDPRTYSSVMMDVNPHAYMIDIHMPVMNGFELYEKIVEHPLYNGCPIFFVSGDVSDESKDKFLKSGAVDFLSRDLSSEEVVLRLSNKIRFYLQTSMKLELGNLLIDIEQFKAFINQNQIELTLLEMRMLSILLRNLPDGVPRSTIIRKIWGDEPVRPGTINTHLTNLKIKVDKWDYFLLVREEKILIKSKT